MFKVLAYGATHVGRERKNNEDAFRIAPDAGVYLVCDGMGGHASGEIASQVAADTMVRFLAMDRFRPDFRWPAEVMQNPFEEARALDAAVRAANREVFLQALANPAHKGMGTTIVGIHAGATRLGLVHVGDSRIYRLRNDVFEQLTEDHSLLNYYMQSRPMTDAQIKQFAAKNVIIRAVGLRETVEPSVQVQDYRAGDIYLLCSDGLNDMVEDAAIERTVRTATNRLAEASEELIEQALEGGGKDNVTVLMLQILEMEDRLGRPDFQRQTMPMDVVDMDTSPSTGVPTLDDEGPFVEEQTSPSYDNSTGTTTGPRQFAKTQPMTLRPFTAALEPVVVDGEEAADVNEPTPPDHTSLHAEAHAASPVMVDNAASDLDWLDAPALPVARDEVPQSAISTVRLPALALQLHAAGRDTSGLDWLDDAPTLAAVDARKLLKKQQAERQGTDSPARVVPNPLTESEFDTDPAVRAISQERAQMDPSGRKVVAPDLKDSDPKPK
jgi:serine/threonine protein phosphatase PrpC